MFKIGVKKLSESKEVRWGEFFKYMGIGFDIIVFAVIGYFVAKYLNWNEILGMMIGALMGTVFMYIHLMYTAGIIRKKKEEGRSKQSDFIKLLAIVM